MAYVLKRPIAAVAKHAHFCARLRLDNRRQVDPPIVIDIDSRQAPSAHRIFKRQLHALKPPANVLRSSNVPPQRQSRRARVRYGNIHPAVLVVIKNRNARRRRQLFSLVQRLRRILPFARIDIKQWRSATARDRDIHGAIVVEVRQNRRHSCSQSAKTCRISPLGERLVSVVAPQHVRRVAGLQRLSSQKQIQIPIVVVIHKRNAQTA